MTEVVKRAGVKEDIIQCEQENNNKTNTRRHSQIE